MIELPVDVLINGFPRHGYIWRSIVEYSVIRHVVYWSIDK